MLYFTAQQDSTMLKVVVNPSLLDCKFCEVHITGVVSPNLYNTENC